MIKFVFLIIIISSQLFGQENEILFTKQINNNDNIYLIDKEGKQQQVTNHNRKDSSPMLSPDGKFMVFTSERVGWWKIWLMGIKKKENIDIIPSKNEKIELNEIEKYMQEEEAFTDPDLSLNVLVERLEFSHRYLSYLINNFLNQNFISFVNNYRIEKAKIRLKNPKDERETISEIMYEVGFNSKSSFNTIFKQHTKFTPSEFKKQS